MSEPYAFPGRVGVFLACVASACGGAEANQTHPVISSATVTASASTPSTPLVVVPGPAREPLAWKGSAVTSADRTGRALPDAARARLGGNFTRATAIGFEENELRVLSKSRVPREDVIEWLSFPTARSVRRWPMTSVYSDVEPSPTGDVYIDGCGTLKHADRKGNFAPIGEGKGKALGCATFSSSGDLAVVSGHVFSVDRSKLAARELAKLDAGCEKGASIDPAATTIACPARSGAKLFDTKGGAKGDVVLSRGPSNLAGRATAFSGDGRWLFVAGDAFIARVDVRTLAVVDAFPTGESPAVLASSKDGSRVATLTRGGAFGKQTNVVLWDTQSGRPFALSDGPNGNGARVAFSPSGARLAWTAADGGAIFFADPSTRVIAKGVPIDFRADALVFATETQIVAASDKELVLVDLEKKEVSARAQRVHIAFQTDTLHKPKNHALVSMDGIVRDVDGLRAVFDARYPRHERGFKPERYPSTALLLEDGKTLVGYVEMNDTVVLARWDLGKDDPKKIGPSKKSFGLVEAIDATPDGNVLLTQVGGSNRKLVVTQTQSGKVLRPIFAGRTGAFVRGDRVAWVEGHHLFVGLANAEKSDKDLGRVDGEFSGAVDSVAVSADRGKLALTGDGEEGILLYDVAD